MRTIELRSWSNTEHKNLRAPWLYEHIYSQPPNEEQKRDTGSIHKAPKDPIASALQEILSNLKCLRGKTM
ncbi:hypothetical protein BofuT4_uP073820.1 [Botrytis cinerea T4]|uniref:Uncharacterized protein n=1 Tax=Botryotinia fuckeliana (strain T4) TaxID=999810 RepID=G2XPG4_BOTF4|nr:hypothetical protein BofuT4_uP073820.1 [Botrytis cinerea T4]